MNINDRKFPWWFYLVGFVLLALLALVNRVDAQQPNPMACDAMANDLIPVIEDRQLDFFSFHGYFFQGLPTHTTPPNTQSFPDNAYTHPTDQPITWYEFLLDDMPDNMPCSFRIDTYDGPTGRGYDIVLEYSDQSRAQQLVVCARTESRGAQSRERGRGTRGWSCE